MATFVGGSLGTSEGWLLGISLITVSVDLVRLKRQSLRPRPDTVGEMNGV